MSLELTDEERAYIAEYIEQFFDTPGVGPIILKLQAGKMKAEFRAGPHHLKVRGLQYICPQCETNAIDSGKDRNTLDPRHTWTDQEWMEAARKVFD